MASNDLQYLLEKLYQIDKELGGKAKDEKGDKKSNEFDNYKNNVYELMHKVNSKQQEREEKIDKYGRQNEDIIRLGIEIRDALQDINIKLQEMDKVLSRQAKKPKKYPKEDLAKRVAIYEQLRKNYEGMFDIENGGSNNEKKKNYQTLTDMKANLYENGGSRQQQETRSDLTPEEAAALRRFKEQDGMMERKLDIIIDGTTQWKNKAGMMGEKIDETNLRIQKVTKEVDKTDQMLKTSNAKLKDLLKKYRAPNKLCLDITLVLFLLGLIAVIINMVKKG